MGVGAQQGGSREDKAGPSLGEGWEEAAPPPSHPAPHSSANELQPALWLERLREEADGQPAHLMPGVCNIPTPDPQSWAFGPRAVSHSRR